ncbi:Cobalt-precorrin-5B C(1)-methyltransferase [Metallosphaera sp. J1]|uniref:cobalt-precorrin-5B (C(1))-methyltransferase CbiD n=1 Tax=Metallosphaera javensis (ex Hofmann et al. 2022) TaxID=99938 RepID=UPI001EE0AC6C|nr:cobalt-precorrin-5B (C(1))-methyltransferase CbiD [Metallosphaera javensis (ex Hofmann et al. 2022)]MCG3108043.1 Cobalt-precorrin-5B C(1)-methyltransferase [Metallosphaera javensis (ex Hofmann et al. 2022)]
MSVRIPLNYQPASPSLSNAKSAKRKILKMGFTTGTALSAAAKGCAYAIMGEMKKAVVVSTPIGLRIEIPLNYVRMEGEWCIASVTKYGGDDPDDTNGMEIIVRMKLNNDRGYVSVRAGKGLGKAVNSGLPVNPGEPAINPVPRKQLVDNLKEVLGDNFGAEIEVIIPDGERIAKRTFNPKLGIEGGVSILGTSGVVKPMSLVSWYASLVEQLDIVKSFGIDRVVLVPGNIGETSARKKLNVDPRSIVQMAIFTGGMLKASARRGFKEILLYGHVGKLIKSAIGIWNSHYKYGDGRLEVITAYAAKHGVAHDDILRLINAKTTDEAINILKNYSYKEIFNEIAERIALNSFNLIEGKAKVHCILINMEGEIVGISSEAGKFLA